MDISQFGTWKNEFSILDFVASYVFKTSNSISFHLGRYSDSLKLGDLEELIILESQSVFNVFGSVDVHHPCESHIKTVLRVVMTGEQWSFGRQTDFVQAVLFALGIPADETYEAFFVSAEKVEAIDQCVDRNGLTDRT